MTPNDLLTRHSAAVVEALNALAGQRGGFEHACRRAGNAVGRDAATLLRVLADVDPSQVIADRRAVLNAERACRQAAAVAARPCAVAATQETDQ